MYTLKIKKEKILKILNKINFVIEKKNILPILTNFLIKKNKKKISFIANDIDNQINIKLKSNKINKFKLSFIVCLKNFLDIIKNFYKNYIYIIMKKKFLLIKQNKIKFELKIIPGSEYPEIKNYFKYKIEILILQKDFIEIINLIHFATSKQNDNNFINGILFSIKKNKIISMSTDNYRLAYINIKIKNTNIKKNLIISNKAIFLLRMLLIKEKSFINIKINNKKIKFMFNKITIISKLINESFPILKSKIKKNYKNFFKINKNIIQYALKRSLSIIKNNIKVNRWLVKKNKLKILTKENDGKGVEEIDINYEGKKIDLKLNNKHIMDLINNINSEQIQFNFPLKKKTVIITIPENKNYKYIITSIED